MDSFTIFETWSVLAQSVLLGLGLTLAVWAILAMALRGNAATRFAVLYLTLITVAALPPALLIRMSMDRPVSHAGMRHVAVAAVPLPTIAPEARAVAPVAAPARAAASSSTPSVPAESVLWPVTKLFIPRDVAEEFLVIYVVIVFFLLVRLGLSYLRIRRLKARSTAAPPELAARFKHWLSLCGTTRPVDLLLTAKLRSPMAVGFGRPAIIVPDSLLLKLTGAELDQLGLHELAHVRRYDDWTNLLQRTIQAVLFFHPAVQLLCRKLDFEREVACDDWVLTLTGEAKPYARSLAKILEFRSWRRGPVLASGAVFRKRQILRRIEMMLDGNRDSKPQLSPVAVVLVLICLFGALSEFVQLPALVAFGNASGGSRSSWNINGRKIEFQSQGDVQFGPDDSIESISPGGYVRISEGGWMGRQVELRPGNGGRLETRYVAAGREEPFDDKAREWLASTLTFVIREAGINAEARAARILERRGVAGVFDEVDRIGSDHSRQKYLSAAIHSGKLNNDDLRRVASRAGRISSDHEKATLLLEAAHFYRADELRAAYFDAVNTINSDHDRRRVLTRVIEEAGGEPAVLLHTGRSVEQMSSDHDKAELLKLPALQAVAADPAARRSLMRAAASINSDHDKANVLINMLASGPVGIEALEEILRVAAKIGSDHDKSRVLEIAAQQGLSDALQQAAFFTAASTIQSDNDRARVLNVFIDRDMSGTIADGLVHSIQQISSDHDKAGVLIKLAARPATPAFVQAAGSINSDNDKRRVLEAMVERGNSADAAKGAVALAATIQSDHDKAQVLAAIAARYGNDAEVRDAVRRAAEKLASDSDYRRIVSGLYASSGETAPPKRPE